MNRACSLLKLCIVLIFVVGSLNACALWPWGKDDVPGEYKGSWFVGNSTTPAGGLDATITEGEAKGEYDTVFRAEFGQRANYEMSLQGRRQGDKVVFEGEEDLGAASGGVFAWKGEIVDGVFTGSYTSRFVNGTFKMTKVEGAAAEVGAPAEPASSTQPAP
jgi:hypothetical protein